MAPEVIRDPYTNVAEAFVANSIRGETYSEKDYDLIDQDWTAISQFLRSACPVSSHIFLTISDEGMRGWPDRVIAGRVAVTLRNDSSAVHGSAFYRILGSPDIEAEVLPSLEPPFDKRDGVTDYYVEGPWFTITNKSGGNEQTKLFDLAPGRYLVADVVPKGSSDSEIGDGPLYWTEGFYGEITVTGPA